MPYICFEQPSLQHVSHTVLRVVQELGSRKAVSLVVSRQRNEHDPPIPELMMNLDIQGEWAETIEDRPGRFLLHDNHHPTRRIIIFCSDHCMAAMARATRWFMDGNFSVAPNGFMQLYIVRVALSDSATVTTAYALLQNKSAETYQDLFQALIQGAANQQLALNPQQIHCDFEQAVIRSVEVAFPAAEVNGCFYHLCQVCRKTSTECM